MLRNSRFKTKLKKLGVRTTKPKNLKTKAMTKMWKFKRTKPKTELEVEQKTTLKMLGLGMKPEKSQSKTMILKIRILVASSLMPLETLGLSMMLKLTKPEVQKAAALLPRLIRSQEGNNTSSSISKDSCPSQFSRKAPTLTIRE